MSFAYELKKEIAQHRPNLVHHKAALAYGLIRFAKYYSADHVALHTEHRFVARLYSTVIADLIQLHYSITTQEKLAGESQYVYVVRVDSAGDRARLLEYFGAPQAGLNAEFFCRRGGFRRLYRRDLSGLRRFQRPQQGISSGIFPDGQRPGGAACPGAGRARPCAQAQPPPGQNRPLL